MCLELDIHEIHEEHQISLLDEGQYWRNGLHLEFGESHKLARCLLHQVKPAQESIRLPGRHSGENFDIKNSST